MAPGETRGVGRTLKVTLSEKKYAVEDQADQVADLVLNGLL